MRIKAAALCSVAVLVMIAVCQSPEERLIRGKWKLAGTITGGAPSSFWFKRGGTVIASWEARSYALQSSGTYVLHNKSRLQVMMKSGFYAGNTYIFDIKKLDGKELILGNNYEEIHLKRSEDSDTQK